MAWLANGLATKKLSGKFASRFVRKVLERRRVSKSLPTSFRVTLVINPLFLKNELLAEPKRAVRIGRGMSPGPPPIRVPPLFLRFVCAFWNSVKILETLTPLALPQSNTGVVVRLTHVNGLLSRFS